MFNRFSNSKTRALNAIVDFSVCGVLANIGTGVESLRKSCGTLTFTSDWRIGISSDANKLIRFTAELFVFFYKFVGFENTFMLFSQSLSSDGFIFIEVITKRDGSNISGEIFS